MPDAGPTPRAPQSRAVATRARLLDAAFDSLHEEGYAATTVGAVQARAGVARGTLLHHFPSRSALMAGVVEDVVARRLTLLAEPATGGDWGDLVDRVWTELQGPGYAVALELWVAARTDADLRAALVPLQEQLFATAHRGVGALVGEDHPRAALLVQFTIDLLTGAHLAGVLAPRPGAAGVVEEWKRVLRRLAAEDGHDEVLPTPSTPRG